MAGMSHITNADAADVGATTHLGLYGQLASGLSDLEVHEHQARMHTHTCKKLYTTEQIQGTFEIF